jgi:hypothetical protein
MKTLYVIISLIMFLGGCSARNIPQQIAWQGVAKQLLAQGGAQNLLSNFGIPINTKYTKSTSTSTPAPTQTAEQKAAHEKEQQYYAAKFMTEINNMGKNAEASPEVQQMRAITGVKAPNTAQSKCYKWCYATYGRNFGGEAGRCHDQCTALYGE